MYDQKPAAAAVDLMKSQGSQDHQQVVFMSDENRLSRCKVCAQRVSPGSDHRNRRVASLARCLRVAPPQQRAEALAIAPDVSVDFTEWLLRRGTPKQRD
jgi:hypothetical protein